MPGVSNQKLKLLYVMQYLERNSDENHVITLKDIIDYLSVHGIRAERKSIYSDIETLKEFGVDILYRKEHPEGYFVASRKFELPELKLLVDAVLASRFVTKKKSAELIHKLETLTSVNEGKKLQRQVFVQSRIKSMNESIYYNVDKIHDAISRNAMLMFQYFEWNIKKEMELKHGGTPYRVSPGALIWADENYYMVAYDESAKSWKHFRVDKMLDIQIQKEKRTAAVMQKGVDMAVYGKQTFGMFSGENDVVKIRFKRHLTGAFVDRFGSEIPMREDGEDDVITRVHVAVSSQFFGWIIGLGGDAQIVAPEKVVAQYRDVLEKALEQ